ncbi:MAG: hypothetical protein U0841_33500 [Chloroflexia bacterium]
MARLRFTQIPAPADAEDDQRTYAVAKNGEYAGWVETSRSGKGWDAYRPSGDAVGARFGTRREAAAALVGNARLSTSATDLAQEREGRRRPHTTLYVTDTEMARLRSLAASLGFFTERGPHAKQRGSVTALAEALAQADARDHRSTLATLRGLLAETAGD